MSQCVLTCAGALACAVPLECILHLSTTLQPLLLELDQEVPKPKVLVVLVGKALAQGALQLEAEDEETDL